MVDLEKAYDSVEWQFLTKALGKHNFGPMLIQWVKTFYNNIESCVTNNHISSPYFKITRGLRQGDPLSSYLFVLCVEVLSIYIRDNKNIEGIKVGEQQIKLAQYADDTTAILKDVASANEFIAALNKFSQVSGLCINQDKTEAIWLGINKNNDCKPLKLKWFKGPIRLLGIFIGHDPEAVSKANFDPSREKLKCQLNIWKQRR